jgi:hypothetical protein
MHIDSITDLVPTAISGTEQMTEWSDEKKADFVRTFEQRSTAARAILELTADTILSIASQRKFISTKHMGQVNKTNTVHGSLGYNRQVESVTGRTWEDLHKVAEQQAKAILEGLPPLKKAVQIIDPDTAKKIDRRDKLVAKGKRLRDELVELAEPIEMTTLDQSMTIGEFRKMIKTRERRQKTLIDQLEEVAKEGNTLENAINKALYAGLPGLSDAVVKAANDCYERSNALDATTRRVAEQVKFGDSEAAMTILQRFEQDEAEVSAEVKAEFADALKKLKLAATTKKRRTKKALPKKGK